MVVAVSSAGQGNPERKPVGHYKLLETEEEVESGPIKGQIKIDMIYKNE